MKPKTGHHTGRTITAPLNIGVGPRVPYHSRHRWKTGGSPNQRLSIIENWLEEILSRWTAVAKIRQGTQRLLLQIHDFHTT